MAEINDTSKFLGINQLQKQKIITHKKRMAISPVYETKALNPVMLPYSRNIKSPMAYSSMPPLTKSNGDISKKL